MAFASPVSSSSVMKQNPLAVPGLWRVMTEPQTFTRFPAGADGSCEAGVTSGSMARASLIG